MKTQENPYCETIMLLCKHFIQFSVEVKNAIFITIQLLDIVTKFHA